MTDFILCTTNLVSAQRNLKYPNHRHITNAADLKNAVARDHVAAEYKGDIRSTDKFMQSTCVVMDIDNDHSNSPADWVTPESLALIFPGVALATATSRNHLKPKGEKTARPRFHAYFPIRPVTDAAVYTGIKKIPV